jgi:CRP-like cAMP-binding protein
MKFFNTKQDSHIRRAENEIMTIKSGECIGELDMFGDQNIKHSAIALTDCDLWYLDLDGMKRSFYV